VAEEKKGMSKGCMIALIVAGVIAVIIIALGIVCYVYQDQLVEWGMEKSLGMISAEMKANLPEGITEDDIDNAINKFKQMIKDKKIETTEIQTLAVKIQEVMEDKKLDTSEVREIFEDLKDIVD